MDFYAVVSKLSSKMSRLSNILADESVHPDVRRAASRAIFESITKSVYTKAYDMNAWDFDIADTIGIGPNSELAIGMARNVSDSVILGNRNDVHDQLKSMLYSTTGKAQHDANTTAKSFGKYTVMRRTIRLETCSWCVAKAGVIKNPTADDYRRHTRCDCKIVVEGFRTRNGEVKNYRPA